MQRVLIIGSPGSGKSTLANDLGRRTGLPVIHLDQHYWRAGWVEPDKEEWKARVGQLLAGERWIIDGNYGGTLAVRLEVADTVIQLNVPAWLCIARVLRRVARTRDSTRVDMAPGCPEHLDLSFLGYIAAYPWRSRRRAERKLASFRGRVIRIGSARQLRRFLASFDPRG